MMIRMIFLSLALAGCSAAAPAAPPTFDPLAFFTGTSRGEGTLKVMTKPSVPIRVESEGRPDGKGGIILDQTIREGSKPARQRRWVLRPTSPTTMTGTITDNPGPVTRAARRQSPAAQLHDEGRAQGRAGADAPARRALARSTA